MEVRIRLKESSQVVKVFKDVINTYTKGPMFCVMYREGDIIRVRKYPLISIFDIDETYD